MNPLAQSYYALRQRLAQRMIGCSLRRSTVQAITTGGSAQAISWDVSIAASSGFVDLAVRPTQVLIPHTGLYNLWFFGVFASSGSAGVREFDILVNGVERAVGRDAAAVAGYVHYQVAFIEACALNAGDIVTFAAYQTSGSTLNLGSNSDDYASLRAVVRLVGCK